MMMFNDNDDNNFDDMSKLFILYDDNILIKNK